MIGPEMRRFALTGAGLLAFYLILGELGFPRVAAWLAFGTAALYLVFGGGGTYLLDLLTHGHWSRRGATVR